jgi:glucosamine--fructose-6-phosphate aminotransferase (isomerizing)
MTERGFHTRQEIFSQPETWHACLKRILQQADTLEAFFRQGQYDQILFTGCGSPYYAALAAAPVAYQLTGLTTRALTGAEVFHYPELSFVPGKRLLLVALSRSGETTELLRACAAFNANQSGDIVTISCYPGAPLTEQGAVSLVLPDAQETSLAQTRAFSSLYLACIALICIWSGRRDLLNAMQRLPEAGRALLDRHSEQAILLGQDPRYERIYFLGSGPRYGLASELSLKMKETSLSHSEPFHVLEYRHGPKAMVNHATLILSLVSSGEDHLEMAVCHEMRAMGATVIVSGEKDTDVSFASGLPEIIQHILHLPFGQLLAYSRSIASGLNPDLPEKLNAVVVL